jgi:hypothetical protein
MENCSRRFEPCYGPGYLVSHGKFHVIGDSNEDREIVEQREMLSLSPGERAGVRADVIPDFTTALKNSYFYITSPLCLRPEICGLPITGLAS